MVQSIKVKNVVKPCEKCGECCKFIFFMVLDIDGDFKKKEYIAINPYFKDKGRTEDYFRWVYYHGSLQYKSTPMDNKMFVLNIQNNKIVDVVKKGKKQYLIKIDAKCNKLRIDNLCSVYPNHPLLCQEEIGFPWVHSCKLRKR